MPEVRETDNADSCGRQSEEPHKQPGKEDEEKNISEEGRKRMIRYMDIIGDKRFDKLVKEELESLVWCLDEKPLDVPYIKLKIKIVGKEPRHISDRKPKKRRFLIFGKEKKSCQ